MARAMGKAAPQSKSGKFKEAIKAAKASGKTAQDKAAPAAPDDMPIIALNLPAAKLSPAMSAYFKKCQDKLGFVPGLWFDEPQVDGSVDTLICCTLDVRRAFGPSLSG